MAGRKSSAVRGVLGDRAGIASAHAHRGMLLQMQGDFVRAGVELETSLRLHRDRGQVYDIGLGLFFLGTLAYLEGNVDHARGLWEESLQLLRAGDDSWDIANVLAHLAMVALDNGDAVQAGAYLRESLGRFRDLDERWQTIRALEISAQQAALRGRHTADAQSHSVQAARLYGAAEALRETMDTPQMAIYRAHYRRAVAVLWTQLDPTAGLAAWAAGRALTLQQAVDEALKTLDGSAEARRSRRGRSGTQGTEQEVGNAVNCAGGRGAQGGGGRRDGSGRGGAAGTAAAYRHILSDPVSTPSWTSARAPLPCAWPENETSSHHRCDSETMPYRNCTVCASFAAKRHSSGCGVWYARASTWSAPWRLTSVTRPGTALCATTRP